MYVCCLSVKNSSAYRMKPKARKMTMDAMKDTLMSGAEVRKYSAFVDWVDAEVKMTVSEYMQMCPPKQTAEISAPAQRNTLQSRAAARGATMGNEMIARPQKLPEANDSSPMTTKMVTGSSAGLTVLRAASTTKSMRPSWPFTSIRV